MIRALSTLLRFTILLLTVTGFSGQLSANGHPLEVIEACLALAVLKADPETTVEELRLVCENSQPDLVQSRALMERSAVSNPFVLLPHRPNYLIPISISDVDDRVYQDQLGNTGFDDIEAQFQISIKYLAVQDFLSKEASLSLAFTTVSWWQSYNSNISAPFRETVYEPEMIWSFQKPWKIFDVPIEYSYLSLNHQSNGKSGALSRSWNRIIGGVVFEKNRIAWRAEAWVRVPEQAKEFPESPKGDDNPDIEKFLGNIQLSALWKLEDEQNLEIFIRNNLRRENKGSIEMGWSYPLTRRLRGYIQYFNGYGNGLIYYDNHSYRLGIGVKITDWL
ncbi:MAG: phospholipase A1 [Planctomycetota bacterium]|jgi:phospholipase A1